MKRVLGVLLALGWLLVCGFGPAGKPVEEDPSDSTRLHLDLTQVLLSDLCWVLEKRTGVPHALADARVPAGGGCGDLTLAALGEMTAGQLRQAMADALGVAWLEAKGAKKLAEIRRQHYRGNRSLHARAAATHGRRDAHRCGCAEC